MRDRATSPSVSVIDGIMDPMSDEEHPAGDDEATQPAKHHVTVERIGPMRTPELDEKLARVAQVAAGAGAADMKNKLATLFGDRPTPALEQLLRVQEDLASRVVRTPAVPVTPMAGLPDPKTTPEYRAAKAAEQTAAHLEVLVGEAIENRVRAEKTERRETVMLRWTIAGVVLAAIAAVASIISILG